MLGRSFPLTPRIPRFLVWVRSVGLPVHEHFPANHASPGMGRDWALFNFGFAMPGTGPSTESNAENILKMLKRSSTMCPKYTKHSHINAHTCPLFAYGRLKLKEARLSA